MNDPLEYTERLARQARRDRAPQGDVLPRVFARLHEERPALARPMLVLAAGYGAAACIALAYGMTLINTMTDPLASMFSAAVVIMP